MLDFPGSAAAAFVAYFIKTTMVLAPAFLAAVLAKRRTAAFRHFLLSFALIGLLFVPLVSILPFGWRTSLLPAGPVDKSPSRSIYTFTGPFGTLEPESPTAALQRDPGVSYSSDSPSTGSKIDATGVSEGTAVSGENGETRTTPRIGELVYSLTAPRLPGFESVRAGSDGKDGTLADALLVSAWILGFVFLLFRLALGLAGARRMTRDGSAPGDPGWRLLLLQFLSIIPLRRSVRLRSHPDVSVPMTWGWRRPVILLPSGADEWTEAERSAALFHELSHIKRADFLFLFLVRLSLSLFWWNPLCWVVYGRIRREQEIACDELVLRAGIKPSSYAAGLLAFRRSAGLRWNPSAALPGLFGTSSFQDRLAAILKQKTIIKEVNMKARIILAAAVILAVALIGTARPAVGNETTGTSAPEPALMASPSPVLPLAGQELKVQTVTAQGKDKEKDKGKVEIIIVRDGKETKLVLDQPLTIKTGKDGNILILDEDGKEIENLKGQTWHLEFKGGQVLKLDEAEGFSVAKDGKNIVIFEKTEGDKGTPVLVKGIRVDEGETTRIKVVEGEPLVVVGKGLKGEGKTAYAVVEPGKSGIAYTFTQKDGKSLIWTAAEKAGIGLAYVGETDKALLEKVKAMREQVAAVKAGKLDIAELDRSLEKLESELADKKDKYVFKNGTVIVGNAKPGVDKNIAYFVTTDKDDKTGGWIGLEEGKAVAFVSGDMLKAGKNFSFISEATEGTSMIILTGKNGAEGKAAFDRVSDRLKKDLPDDFQIVESKYDEESGTITFKLKSPSDKKIDADVMRKLVDGLKEELKK